MGVSHPFVAPPHLQSLPYCNTIARPFRNICPPHQPPFCMPYTIQYWRWQYQYRVKAKSLTAPKGYPPWCLRHAGALAWRREPVLCACTRVCWCVSRRIFTYVYYIIIYIYTYLTQTQWRKKLFSSYPNFADGRMAIARRLSSAARPAAHRRGAHRPPGPPACVVQAGGQRADRTGRQLAAESSPARNARSGPNG